MNRLQKLKGMINRGADYTQAMEFFCDHFYESGEPIQDPFLEGAVEAAVVYMTGEAGLGEFRALSLAGGQLLHGGFRGKGRAGMFFFFEDIRTGVACVADGSGKPRLARFKATVLSEN